MDLLTDKELLLNINFNQDGSCFAIGTEKGFKIFTSSPFKEYSDRSIHKFKIDLDGGLGKVEMLYKSNVVALLGGGKKPKYTSNKIVLWDDSQQKVITEIRLNNEVVNVKLKKEKFYN